MSGTTTLEKIRKTAERRQALWSKMSSLTEADRADIVRLTSTLEALWEQHRVELARHPAQPGRRPPRPSTSSPRKRTAA